MILRSLKLENIRSYKTTTIAFPKGISLFEGDIGSGKSTIPVSYTHLTLPTNREV